MPLLNVAGNDDFPGSVRVFASPTHTLVNVFGVSAAASANRADSNSENDSETVSTLTTSCLRLHKDNAFLDRRAALPLVERLQQFSHLTMSRYYAANQVWASALALAEVVALSLTNQNHQCHESLSDSDSDPLLIIELGCGLGVTGMLAHRALSSTTNRRRRVVTFLTDLPSVVGENTPLDKNLKQNFAGLTDVNIFGRGHDWSEEKLRESTEMLLSEGVEKLSYSNNSEDVSLLVLCADCVHSHLYGDECPAMLVSAIMEIIGQVTNTADQDANRIRDFTLLLTLENRSPDDGTDGFFKNLFERVQEKVGGNGNADNSESWKLNELSRVPNLRGELEDGFEKLKVRKTGPESSINREGEKSNSTVNSETATSAAAASSYPWERVYRDDETELSYESVELLRIRMCRR